MCDRSCDQSANVSSRHAELSFFRPTVPLRRRGRFLFLLLRRLTSEARAWWSADEASLRAIAAVDDTRIDELSETGRQLRRSARQRPRKYS